MFENWFAWKINAFIWFEIFYFHFCKVQMNNSYFSLIFINRLTPILLDLISKKYEETPVFPLGIAALRRRNLGEKMVAGSIPLKGHFWELLNRLLNFWYWSDEFEKQTRTRKVTSTVRSYLYPVHRTPTDDPIYGGGNGPRWG